MLLKHQKISVPADGNCQFSAIALGLKDTIGESILECDVRCSVCLELKTFPEEYKAFITRDYTEYIEDMQESGTWGDQVTLMAASRAYQINIIIVSDGKVVEVHTPKCSKPVWGVETNGERDVFLNFANLHYDYVRVSKKQVTTLRKIAWTCGCDYQKLLNVKRERDYLTLLTSSERQDISVPCFWLYDSDLVSEETFLGFSTDRADKFMNWLETAEEEN